MDFRKWDGEAWTGLIWLTIWIGGERTCEHGNKFSGYIRGGEFLDSLKTCWVVSKDTAPWS